MFGPLYKDAFSSGQISSKLWLCEELEKIETGLPKIIWLYGGWYGITALLLLSRGTLPISLVRSFDVDPLCEPIADTLLENWVWQDWKFKAKTEDCNKIIFKDHVRPHIIINTSTEHFTSIDWFDNIPPNTTVVLQSNNMPHEDHVSCYDKLDDFVKTFPFTNLLYKGNLDFKYPTWEFSRYMIIGRK